MLFSVVACGAKNAIVINIAIIVSVITLIPFSEFQNITDSLYFLFFYIKAQNLANMTNVRSS